MTDLERTLRDLGRAEPWPPTRDIAASVGERLRGAAGVSRLRLAGRRRVVAIALAALVALPAGGAVAFPDARDDVLEWLGLRSIEVRRSPTPPQGRPLSPEPDLGARVSMAGARRHAGFDPLVPEALGPPDDVRVLGGRVSLVYEREGRIPLLVTAQRGGRVLAEKVVGPGTEVRPVRIDGAPGAWITGRPHAIVFEDDQGRLRDDELRLAADALVWERDGLVLRIEGASSLSAALRIARSLR